MKLKGLRWWIIYAIAFATIINYIDRSALAIMWPAISEDLGIDKTKYALIGTIFLVSYAFGQSIFGKIFDAIGVRLGFVVAIVVWSVGTCLHAVANSLSTFAIFRVILGLGEAGPWPGATKSNALWFPTRERALAQGIFNSGAAMGSIIAPPLIGLLYAFVGWKATFFIIGAGGLLWIIPWLILYKSDPETHPWVSEDERACILGSRGDEKLSDEEEYVPGWFELLKIRQSWSVLGARFFIEPIWWLFAFWLPLYLNEKFGFHVKEIAFTAWVPYVGAAAGALAGGWVSGILFKLGKSTNVVRKTVITLGVLLIVPALLFAGSASTPFAALALITIVLFGFQFTIGSIQTLPSDFFSGKTVGSLAGMGGSVGLFGVIVVTNLVPIMTKDGNYASVFIMTGLMLPFALASVWFLAGRIERVKGKGRVEQGTEV